MFDIVVNLKINETVTSELSAKETFDFGKRKRTVEVREVREVYKKRVRKATYTETIPSSEDIINPCISVACDAFITISSAKVYERRYDALASALSPENMIEDLPAKVKDYESLKQEWKVALAELERYNRCKISEDEIKFASLLIDKVKILQSECAKLLDPDDKLGETAKKLFELDKFHLISHWANGKGDSYYIGFDDKADEFTMPDLCTRISKWEYKMFLKSWRRTEKALRKKVHGEPLSKVDQNYIRNTPYFIRRVESRFNQTDKTSQISFK